MAERGFQQALFTDAQDSHHAHKTTYRDPGLRPWVAPDNYRTRSPTAHERRLETQRQRWVQAKANPKPVPKAAAAATAAAKALPRQVNRAQRGKTYYAGHDQRRVTAEERAAWEHVCAFPGCNPRFQTERALRIHSTKADKPGGIHTLLQVDVLTDVPHLYHS